MKRCPLCGRTYPNDANFCPIDAGKLTDAPAGNGAPAPGPAVTDDALTTQAQLIGGRFRPLDRLGGSVTGEVVRARDGQANADVAVKVVAQPVYPTPLALERAQRELKQLAKLMSPRVVRVLDSGKLGDKQLWIGMELVNGRPLSALVGEGGPMDVARASRIVVEIGEALIEAQKVGVVHRDVAPKNVLIENASGGVRLTNFAVPVPVSDKIAGVVEYLSPEQAEGKPVDQRSNIYSLGALYYYLLVGQPPFVGDVNTVMRQHINSAVTPPSQRQPGIPAEADQAIMKALEKSSSRRHLTLRQLLNDVEKLAGGAGPGVMAQAKDTPAKKTIAFGAVVPPAHAPPGPAGAASTTPGFSQVAVAQAAGLTPSAPPHAPTLMPQPQAQPAYAPQPQAPLAFAPPPQAPQPQAPLAFAPPPQAPQPAYAPQAQAPLAFAPPAQAPAPQPMAPPPQAQTPMAPQPQKAPQPQMAAGGPSAGGAAAKPPSMSKGKKGKKDAKFRETMWFKKGALEEQLAQQPPPPEGQEPAVKADTREIDEKYQDDGTLSAEDRQKHSLRTGATQMLAAMNVPQQAALPGERMSAADIAKEYQTGRKWLWLVIAVGVVIVTLVVIFLVRNNGSSKKDTPPPAGGAAPATK